MQKRKNKNKKRMKTPRFMRKKNENRFGMTAAAIAILSIMFVVGIQSVSLVQKERRYAAREQELIKLIEAEDARAKEIEEFATYTKTKKYAEEVAKDKLGLVYENEIIFQEKK